MEEKKNELLKLIVSLVNIIITLGKKEISNITNIIGENLNDKSEEQLAIIIVELKEIIKKLKIKYKIIENPIPQKKATATNGNTDISKNKKKPAIKKAAAPNNNKVASKKEKTNKSKTTKSGGR